MLKVNVGSKNPAKVDSVRQTLEQYDFLKPFEVNSMDVSSGVSEQPKTIDEVFRGSNNRARNSFVSCDYSIGLESGMLKVPSSNFKSVLKIKRQTFPVESICQSFARIPWTFPSIKSETKVA